MSRKGWDLVRFEFFLNHPLYIRIYEYTYFKYHLVQLTTLAKAIAEFNRKSNRTIGFYVSTIYTNDAVNYTEMHYNLTHKILSDNNSNGKTNFLGIYLSDDFKSYEDRLETAVKVFGSKEASIFPIGYLIIGNCSAKASDKRAREFFQILNFITCFTVPPWVSSPEETADKFLLTCKDVKRSLELMNITAELMFQVGFPSEGFVFIPALPIIQPSLSNFQRFWCRIWKLVKNKNMNKSSTLQFKIIFNSAFDMELNFPQQSVPYHTGWWRRLSRSSFEPGAFVEKVDELPENNRTCEKLCTPCKIKLQDCCLGRCEPYNSSTSGMCRLQSSICGDDGDNFSLETNSSFNTTNKTTASQELTFVVNTLQLLLITILGFIIIAGVVITAAYNFHIVRFAKYFYF